MPVRKTVSTALVGSMQIQPKGKESGMNLDTLETASPPESMSHTPRNLADLAFKRGPSIEHAAHAAMPGEKVRERMGSLDSLSEIGSGSARGEPGLGSLSMSEEDPTTKKDTKPSPEGKMLIKEKTTGPIAAEGGENQQNFEVEVRQPAPKQSILRKPTIIFNEKGNTADRISPANITPVGERNMTVPNTPPIEP